MRALYSAQCFFRMEGAMYGYQSLMVKKSCTNDRPTAAPKVRAASPQTRMRKALQCLDTLKANALLHSNSDDGIPNLA